MAITLGTFTKQDSGAFTGTLKTLNVTAALTIVPVDKMSDNAPDHRVYAGPRYEVGAGWRPPNSGRTGFAAASSSSNSRSKTAPPTWLCGSRATGDADRPAAGHRGGVFLV
jgi:hypothetical protein